MKNKKETFDNQIAIAQVEDVSKRILNINPQNKAIIFLSKRIKNKKYRGIHIAQHNRLDFEIFDAIITSLENKVISIPKGDHGKSFQLGDFPEYNKFTYEVNKKAGKGTANSLKKNFFPDLEKMQVINREINNKIEVVYLTNYTNNNYINKDIKTKKEFFEEVSEKFYKDLIPNIFYLLKNLKNNQITFDEFMLFFTWIKSDKLKLNKKQIGYEIEQIEELINEWRNLNIISKKTLLTIIKTLEPKNFPKNTGKKFLRDYSNWKNESQQILSHFKNSNLMKIDNKRNILLIFDKTNEEFKRIRVPSIKKEYLEKHQKSKEKGFEFDHIVPFSWSTSYREAIILENWKNLIYIDAKSHSIKSQSKNQYCILEKNGNLSLKSIINDKEKIILKENENVLFNLKLFDKIKSYNKEILENLK